MFYWMITTLVAVIGISSWTYPSLSGLFAVIVQSLVYFLLVFIVLFKRKWFLEFGGNSYYWLVPITAACLFHAFGFKFLYPDAPLTFRFFWTFLLNALLLVFFMQFEYHQTFSQLKKSEEKFHTLVRRAPLPLCYVDSKGKLEYTNDRFTELLGYTTEDVPDLDAWWERAYPDPEYRKWVLSAWDKAIQDARNQGADIQPIEYQVTSKNGQVRMFQIGSIMLLDGFLATFMDVTERHEAQKELVKKMWS
jgi:PAS domain S-box-containing protein